MALIPLHEVTVVFETRISDQAVAIYVLDPSIEEVSSEVLSYDLHVGDLTTFGIEPWPASEERDFIIWLTRAYLHIFCCDIATSNMAPTYEEIDGREEWHVYLANFGFLPAESLHVTKVDDELFQIFSVNPADMVHMIVIVRVTSNGDNVHFDPIDIDDQGLIENILLTFLAEISGVDSEILLNSLEEPGDFTN